jgi:hypothetical protein
MVSGTSMMYLIVKEKAFIDYNEYRPNSSIDYLLYREFRRKFLKGSTQEKIQEQRKRGESK